MPRNAPKEVIEHRITLGDFERKRLDELTSAYNRDKWLENIPQVGLGVGLLGIGAGIAGGAYIIGKVMSEHWGILNDVFGGNPDGTFWRAPEQSIGDMLLFGSKSVETNRDYNEDGVVGDAYRDPDNPNRRINPFYGIPVVAPLFGLGMGIGEKTADKFVGLVND